MKSHRGSERRSWHSDRAKKSGHFLFQFDPLFSRGMAEKSIPKSVRRVSKPHSEGEKMNILIYLVVAAVIGWVAAELMHDRSSLL
ncbi:MAG TPA: hypothetical protein VII90_07920, partial [Anaerolineales bacterium]